MNHNREILINAFPKNIMGEVENVLDKINLKAEHEPSDSFTAFVKGEKLEIPYRVYYGTGNLELSQSFTPIQKEILNCIYSRHHDGHVRENCLRDIIGSNNIWVVPYVIRLLGEYVIEILHVIKSHLPEINHNIYKEFLAENLPYYETNKRRVTSYWDCYYRNKFQNRNEYVGFQVLEALDNILK